MITPAVAWLATVALTIIIATLAPFWCKRVFFYLRRLKLIMLVMTMSVGLTTLYMDFYAISVFNKAMAETWVHPGIYLTFIWATFLTTGFLTSRRNKKLRNVPQRVVR